MPSLYMTQGIAYIEVLIDVTPLESIMGEPLTCSAKDSKLEIGLLGPLLQ